MWNIDLWSLKWSIKSIFDKRIIQDTCVCIYAKTNTRCIFSYTYTHTIIHTHAQKYELFLKVDNRILVFDLATKEYRDYDENDTLMPPEPWQVCLSVSFCVCLNVVVLMSQRRLSPGTCAFCLLKSVLLMSYIMTL
jgi:hypothetical protein